MILSAIIFIALLLIISVFPITGNIKTMSVLSGSMEPAIHTGSVIVVKPVSNYKIGDVISFGKNTKTDIPTTHRIVEVRAQEGQMIYKTKGDANNSEDTSEVLQKDVIGKVYFSIPYLGYIIDFVKKPVGLMVVIIIPAVIIVYDEIQNIFKEIVKIKEKKVLAKKDEENKE